MRADIHDGQEHKRSIHGPDTEAQDQSSPSVYITRLSVRSPFWMSPRASAYRLSIFEEAATAGRLAE
jgi:hypothetical protein